MRVCAEPGCPNLRPCPVHAKAGQRRADANRPSSTDRGYGRRWAKVSRAFLKANPICVACGAPSEQADHIDGRGPLAPDGLDWSALQPLCLPCHGRKTATFDGGFGNQPKARPA